MFSERKGFHITFTPFQLEFLALDPFFHDMDYTAETSENVTSLNFGITVENLGTIHARPVITVIFEAATSVTAFQFNNLTNGGVMNITHSFSAGDILVIDAEASTVTINGAQVDYDGLFPRLDYGSNNCSLVTTGSAAQFTSTISFKRSYL
jgi:phage-related protein